MRGAEVKSVGVRQGLPWATVYALLPDSGGRLWMSGLTGLARVDGGALDAVADGRAPRLEPRVFGRGDGLPVDETNGGGNVAARGPDGRLWFATPRGTVFIDPAAVAEPPRSPASVLEEVRAGARRLARNGGEVAPDERTLLIRYTAPTFDRPDALRFRYRLDGVDADWVDAGSRRVAMYTGLDPGVRTFRVAALADGAADYGPEASIALELRPAFVETAVFKALLAALALALVALVHRWRTRQLVARQRLLGHLVDERTRELAHAQSELVALNADLEQRVDRAVTSLRAAERMAAYGHTVAGVAHEVRQPLFALGTTAFVLGDKLRDRPELAGELQLLDRETRRMNRVMEELLDFAKPRELLLGPTDLAGLVREAVDTFRAEHDPEARVPVTLALDEALGEVRLDAGRLQQVLVNLLHNAQKHAAGLTRVTVATLAAGPGRVAIEVGDDGRGIAPGDLERVFEPFFTTGGTGLGLAIARRIVVEHGGDMTVRSSAAGTTFRIELPLDGPAHAP
ncbi:MAG: ATP-binding protein [Myxococcota bacterium]